MDVSFDEKIANFIHIKSQKNHAEPRKSSEKL